MITSLQDVLDRQAELNKKKRILQLRIDIDGDSESYAEEWLALAREYKEIDSRANTAFCLYRYYHYKPARRLEENEHIVPEPEYQDDTFDWQNRVDIG